MPLVKSSSNKAFKQNVREMVKSGHPQKQALAAAYATKRSMSKKKMAEGGQVNSSAMNCEACAMAEGGLCDSHLGQKDYDIEHRDVPNKEVTKDTHNMSQGGMAENEGPKLSHLSKDVLQRQSYKERNWDTQKYAEGGKVNAMRPLQQNPTNDNLELDEQESPIRTPSEDVDAKLQSTQSYSGGEQDLPQLSTNISLAQEIMKDRKRRMLAEGGMVMKSSKPRLEGAMAVGSLEDGIDSPDMSDLSNNSDEMNASPEDGRESRGMNIAVPHVMSDDMHDQEDASKDSDYEHNDDSLIGEILRDRKRRRRE